MRLSKVKIAIRILPSFLLVTLNAKMIQRFHEVIERRSILQAKIFIEGSSKLSLTGNMTSEPRGWVCESGETKRSEEKVVKDSEEEREERRSSNEVICENFKLIVLRPQLGNNNKGGEDREREQQLYFGNVES